MSFINDGMQELLAKHREQEASHPPVVQRTKAKPTKKEGMIQAAPKETARNRQAPKFPMLDQGVVAAALQAGVSEANLLEMQRLIGSNAKASKLKDINPKVKPDPLSEEEDGAEAEAAEAEDAGLAAAPGDPVHHALQKLTAIMEVLTLDKKKKSSTSRLDMALDSAAASGSDHQSLGSGKKSI